MTYSLRIKFLLPLLVAGGLLAVGGSWLSYQATVEQLRSQLLQRGHTLATAIDEAIKIASNDVEIRFAVEEIIKEEAGVSGITVATKDPFVIWASSFHRGAEPDIVTQHMLTHLKKSLKHGIFGHHFNEHGDLEMMFPLSARNVDDVAEMSPPRSSVTVQELESKLMMSGDVAGDHHVLPTSAYRGAIHLIFDWSEIQQTSSSMLWSSIFTLLAGIAAITLLATVILYRTVLWPIDAIGAVMQRQREGERNTRVPEIKRDEIGELGLAFNNMLNAMTESEDKHRLLFESMAQGVVYQDESGKITSANTAAQEILGLSLEQMQGRTSVDPRWKIIHENGDDFPGETHPAMEALRTGKVVRNVVMGVYHPEEQQHRWIIVNAIPQIRHGEDKPREVYTTFTDITELKQTEVALQDSQRYNRMLFEQSRIGLALCRMNGELVDLNPAYAQIIGRSITAAKALSYWEITPEKYAADEQRQLESLKTSGSYGPYEKEYIHKDGHLVPVRLQGLLLEKGGETFIWSSVEDITERKQTEDELNKYRYQLEELVETRTKALEHSNKELESYSYSIAHDLRAPLRSIVGFSQILIEDAGDKLDSDDQEHLQRIIKSGKHMSNLIDDILELSRMSRTHMQFDKVNLSNICLQISKALGETNPERRVEWHIQPDVTVNGDQHLLYMVLSNLLGNAWKFTQKKSQALIEFGVTDEADEKVYYVRDNGAGFDMKYVDKMFELFQRLHQPEEYKGSGVGLATVQRIINRHNGWVRAEGEKGKCATIYFSIPVAARSL